MVDIAKVVKKFLYFVFFIYIDDFLFYSSDVAIPMDSNTLCTKSIKEGPERIMKAPIKTKTIEFFAFAMDSGLSFCFAEMSLSHI